MDYSLMVSSSLLLMEYKAKAMEYHLASELTKLHQRPLSESGCSVTYRSTHPIPLELECCNNGCQNISAGLQQRLTITDLVDGGSLALPPELEEGIKRRGFIASWCSQEEVVDNVNSILSPALIEKVQCNLLVVVPTKLDQYPSQKHTLDLVRCNDKSEAQNELDVDLQEL
ncbi:hypothetical protein Tco_1464936, partial [Tanacetum coccineum]